jgi:hypothetical protein
MRCVDRALPHGLCDAAPESGSCVVWFVGGWLIRISAQKINNRKEHDFECQADHEQLLI